MASISRSRKRSRKRRRRHDQESQSLESKYEEDLKSAFTTNNKEMAEQLLRDVCSTRRLTDVRIRTILMDSVIYVRLHLRVAMVSLLHLAAYWGWYDIAVSLVTVHQCSAECKDEKGHTPLHYAARSGYLELVKYFITVLKCDPMTRSNYDSTPLHHACSNGHLNVAQYLISEAHCDPSCVDNAGNTPLHCACSGGYYHSRPTLTRRIGTIIVYGPGSNPPSGLIFRASGPPQVCLHPDIGQPDVVQYLLSTGRVNPLAENKDGNTPIYLGESNDDVIRLLQPFVDCSRDFRVNTFTKLILTGDSSAGKTTIAQLITLLADRANSDVAVDDITSVQCFTAGIIPQKVESRLGNFVIYDFAGQQEYYSSHAAVLEQVMRKSAATFLCTIDLSKNKETICQSLQYWLTFINNACSIAEGTSHVAIVGSHVDLITSSEEMEEKVSLVQVIAASRVKHQHYAGCVTMDCRRANTDASRQLISIFTDCHKAIVTSQPAINSYCHVLYAFLHTKLQVVGCTLEYLLSAITKENSPCLPNDPSVITELLTTISNKGLILFIQQPQASWIIVKTEILLNDINGKLFAPRLYKEHCNLASNTGIVPVSNLYEVFNQVSKEMLRGFLLSLDFCRPVDPSVLQYTNLQTKPSQSTDDLLFFPGLVQSERPDSLIQQRTLQFGWCLGCLDPNQFFGSRFLHLLVLFVAYRFPLAARHNPASSLCGLQRRCTVWKNGISWRDTDNITTVVELIDKNRWVLVAMSCSKDRPVEHAKLRSELISLVCNLHQEQCSTVTVCEYLVSPSLIQKYPLEALPDTDLFDLHDVAVSILLRKLSILSQDKDCIGDLPTQSLPFEPYHLISPSSVCHLFNSNMADQPVPHPLLQEVKRHICIPGDIQVYKELREQLDKLSIFAGRNPLVS